MADKRHLSNAPIKEAIIDIQVHFEEQIPLAELKSELVEIEKDYPNMEMIERRGISIEQSPECVTHKTINEALVCLKYTNTYNTYIAQFKEDGFTFSMLEPYPDWEIFRDEAYRLWNIYAGKANPTNINRIATRYVNVMELKADTSNIGEYLTQTSSVSVSDKKRLESFLNRNVFHDIEYDSTVILTQALNIMNDGNIRLILDIDVFKTKNYSLEDKIYLNHFEQLHDLKNRIFFESITEKTVEIYA